ncbi:immediate early response 3-interacting protein 1-like [Nannochloropsis oceanica]
MAFTLWSLYKSGLLFINGVAVLHRKRFLRKYGLDVAESSDATSIKTQIIGLLNAIQYLKVPLITLNIATVMVELLFGG